MGGEDSLSHGHRSSHSLKNVSGKGSPREATEKEKDRLPHRVDFVEMQLVIWGLRASSIWALSPFFASQSSALLLFSLMIVPSLLAFQQPFWPFNEVLCVHACSVSRSCPTLCDLMDCGCKAPLPIGFPRQEYWSELPFSSPGDLPHPGIKCTCPALAGRFFTSEAAGNP